MLQEMMSLARRKVNSDSSAPSDEVEDSPTALMQNALAQADESSQEDRQGEQQEPDTKFPLDWGGNFECLGELIVESLAKPTEVIQVYQALKEAMNTDILYVNPRGNGTSIFCGVGDSASFLTSLSSMPRVTSWVLTYR